VINSSGVFVGRQVISTSGGCTAGSFTTGNGCQVGSLNSTGLIYCTAGGTFSGQVQAGSFYTGGNMQCQSLTVTGSMSFGAVTMGGLTCSSITMNNVVRADTNGVWVSSVQTNQHVYGGDFGIYGVATGVTATYTVALSGGGSQQLIFRGGILCNQ
jgi:hypothetical protein